MKHRAIIFILILLAFVVSVVTLVNKKQRVPRVTLIATGDSGTGGADQFQVARAMQTSCKEKECDGFVLLGDVIYDQGVSSLQDLQFIAKFELPYQSMTKPFFVVMGNHDYLGCAECYISYSTMSARWKMPNYYYKQSFDNIVDLFVIDTEKLDQEQVSWANSEIKKSRSQWKIVAGHHPLISHDKRHGNATDDKKALLEQVLCNNVDVYLAGHAHNLEDAGDSCGVRLFIAGGGGAPVGDVEPNQSPFVASTHGFVLITATNAELSATFYNEKSKILYHWKRAEF